MINPKASDHREIRGLATVEVLARCAADTGDTVAWAEFIRRMNAPIRNFIRGTMRSEGIPPTHENDLYQNVVLKLVSHDCAVLRRFTGSSDDELRAYVAVVTRSVVRDFGRQQRAAKRPQQEAAVPVWDEIAEAAHFGSASTQEQQLLSRELIQLGKRIVKRDCRDFSERDYLIFVLYYTNGLSTPEIARCRGVGLSQRAVVDVINKLTERVRKEADSISPEGTRR
jgi:RNA polymerase sigma factor (sigma-70 family)